VALPQDNNRSAGTRAIHKEEAIFLIRMLKKDLKVKFLTPKLVNEAFPDVNVEALKKNKEKEIKV